MGCLCSISKPSENLGNHIEDYGSFGHYLQNPVTNSSRTRANGSFVRGHMILQLAYFSLVNLFPDHHFVTPKDMNRVEVQLEYWMNLEEDVSQIDCLWRTYTTILQQPMFTIKTTVQALPKYSSHIWSGDVWNDPMYTIKNEKVWTNCN